jgi:hypothetical protein
MGKGTALTIFPFLRIDTIQLHMVAIIQIENGACLVGAPGSGMGSQSLMAPIQMLATGMYLCMFTSKEEATMA